MARLTAATRSLAFPAMGAAAVFYLIWEIVHRGIYGYAAYLYPLDDADEWRYTACSRLVLHGYALFDQVFSAQPPLFFLSLAGGMRLFGDSIAGARWTEILFGLLALVSAMAFAWQLGGPVSAAVTGVLLAVSPGFLVYSHTVESEMPMTALCTLSLALLAAYGRRGYLIWPFAAGLALAAAVLMKLFALEVLAPAVLLIVLRAWPERRRVLRGLLGYGVGLLLPVALDFALIAPRVQWQQVVAMHNRAAQVYLPNLMPPLQVFHRFISFEPGLTALAVAGVLILLLAGLWHVAAVQIAWLFGSVLMLLAFRPLFPHHLAILLPPMAVAAGLGAAPLFTPTGGARRRATLPVALLAGLIYVVALPRLVHADRHILIATAAPSASPLARFVDRATRAGDIVAADDLRVADGADRLVAPPLCDPSNVRLRSGYLTLPDATAAISRYHVTLVIPSAGLYSQIPGFIPWLQSHLQARQAPGVTVYGRK